MLDFGEIYNIQKISNKKYFYKTQVGDVTALGEFTEGFPKKVILNFPNNYWVGSWKNGWFVRGIKNITAGNILKQIGEFKNGKLKKGYCIYNTVFTISEEGSFDNNGQLKRGVKKTLCLNLTEEGEFSNGFLTRGIRKIETDGGNCYIESGIFSKNKLIDNLSDLQLKPVLYFNNSNLIHVKFYGSIPPKIFLKKGKIHKLFKKNKYYIGFIFDKKNNILEAGYFKKTEKNYKLKYGYKNNT